MAARGDSPAPQSTIPFFPGANRAAEILRQLELYKGIRTIMVPPDRAQLQVRMNALLDGKRLIMATPGLRDGFYLLEKQWLGAKHWARAARSSGVRKFGKRLTTSREDIGQVDILVTGAVAVDSRGGRIGKGSGYFDLEYAILCEIGCVKEETPVVALVDDLQLYEEVPREQHDISVDYIVTPTRVIRVEDVYRRSVHIDWQGLDSVRIRRIRALRELTQYDTRKS